MKTIVMLSSAIALSLAANMSLAGYGGGFGYGNLDQQPGVKQEGQRMPGAKPKGKRHMKRFGIIISVEDGKVVAKPMGRITTAKEQCLPENIIDKVAQSGIVLPTDECEPVRVITQDYVQCLRELRFGEMVADGQDGVSQEEFEAFVAMKKEQRVEEAFGKVDANGDELVNLEEIGQRRQQRLEEALNKAANCGAENLPSLEEVAQRRQQRLEAVFNEVDADEDGVLNLAEFKDFVAKKRQRHPKSAVKARTSQGKGAQRGGKKRQGGLNGQGKEKGNRLESRFARLDQNEDGLISKDEFTLNLPLFDKFDTNENGVITEEELSQKPSRQ
jgi:Ca2+-binding EF-hand superfamily protein